MLRFCWICLVVLVLGACSKAPEPFGLTDITGATFARQFSLIDHNGQARSLKYYSGKVVWLFFGYTNCPDVCPTMMSQLALAQKKLAADSGRVQVLFVTLDPERDTPDILKQYVPAFNPAFIGLSGSEAQVQQTAKEFKVFSQKNATAGSKNYTVDHSSSVFVFDAQGNPRLFYTPAHTIETLVADTRRLLQE